jgi:hypothetical protein
MSRIRKAYEVRFHALLLRLHARRVEKGLAWLINKAREDPAGSPTTRSLCRRYEHFKNQVKRWERRAHPASPPAARLQLRFLCDAGLGGLARWLRAAGYETFWFPDIEDAELLRKARQLEAVVLTTDSLMMERGVLRDGLIPSLWLPPVLVKQEQLALVLREFDLETREPRCMRCGGQLRRVDKETVRDRIPPKTWLWIDEYFVCAACGQLFWRGTHWQKIRQQLEKQRFSQIQNR